MDIFNLPYPNSNQPKLCAVLELMSKKYAIGMKIRILGRSYKILKTL